MAPAATRRRIMQLYHGRHTGTPALHEGICLTSDADSAQHYAGSRGLVASVTLPEWAVVERCPGYDHDANDAPADRAAYREAAAARGIDVLLYEDEDERGCAHDCYRLVSERIVAAATMTIIEEEE